jgi:hypothetical protein
MPQMHSTTHLGYGPVISPTGVACLCSTAAPAPPGLIPCYFGSKPENRFVFLGRPLALLPAHMTGGAARSRGAFKVEKEGPPLTAEVPTLCRVAMRSSR